MSEECTHDCSSCSENCADRDKESFIEKPHKLSKINKVIGVVSGKGGVGKSLVTSLLASKMTNLGYKVGIIDGDITGPSIPKIFGVNNAQVYQAEDAILPVKSKKGTNIMSMNLLLEHEADPVVWRGPVIAGALTQFWTDVIWDDIDYMFIDMPPGTGDVPLTVFQSIPVDGIVIVTSPQELVSVIVEKAVKMANMMDINVLGIIENMSYMLCPHCDDKIDIFGKSHIEKIVKDFGTEVLGKIPLDPDIAKACDEGVLEMFETDYIDKAIEKIKKL